MRYNKFNTLKTLVYIPKPSCLPPAPLGGAGLIPACVPATLADGYCDFTTPHLALSVAFNT